MASRLATKTLLKIAETLEKRKERREERKEKNNSTTTVDAGIGNYTSTSTGVTVGGTTPSQSTPSSIGTSTSSSSSSRKSSGGKSTILTPTSGATTNQTSTAQPTPTAREALISGKTGRPSGRTTKDYTNINPQQTTIQQNPPTIEEINRRNQLNENILTADLNQRTQNERRFETSVTNLENIYKQSEELSEEIDKINKDLEANRYNIEQYNNYINEEGKFEGTEEEYESYKKDYDKFEKLYEEAEQMYKEYDGLVQDYEIEQKKIVSTGGKISDEGMISSPTIKVGIGKLTREVPFANYEKLTSGRPLLVASTAFSTIGDTVLATKSIFFEKGLNVVGRKLGRQEESGSIIWRNPSKVTTTTSERIGTQYFVPQGTIQNGKTTPYTQQVFIPKMVKVEEKQQVTSENLGEGYFKGSSLGLNIIKYSISYAGMAFYAGDIGDRVRTYGGVKGYFKEKPGEAILTATAFATPILMKGYKYLKSKSIESSIRTQLRLLEGSKLKSQLLKGKGLIIDETTKRVVYSGTRSLKSTKGGAALQTIAFEGKLGSKGIIGTGAVTTRGVVQPTLLGIKLKPRAYSIEQTFKLSTVGKSKALGNVLLKGKEFSGLTPYKITEIKAYQQLGKTIVTPNKLGSFGITKVKSTSLTDLEKATFKMTPIKLGKTSTLSLTADEIFYTTKGSIGKQIAATEFEKGFTYKPQSVRETTDVLVIPKSSGITRIATGRKKSSPEFIKSLYTTSTISVPVLKKIPKISEIVKETSPLVSLKSPTSTKTLPKFWGTGQYERTKEVLTPMTRSGVSNLALIEFELPQTGGGTSLRSSGSSKTKDIVTPITPSLPIESNIQPQVTLQRPSQLQQQKLIQRLLERQSSLSSLKSSQMSSFKSGFVNFDFKLVKPKLKIKTKSKGEFEAVGFRFGKPVSLGKFEEKRVASKELKEFLSSTLGASGYLKFGEKKLKAEETGLLEEFGFRKSKTGNKFLVVEEKPFRLRRGNSTGKQIQAFRFR